MPCHELVMNGGLSGGQAERRAEVRRVGRAWGRSSEVAGCGPRWSYRINIFKKVIFRL